MTFALDQLNLTDILFERMPVGIAVFTNTLHLQRFNPTWAEFIARYTPLSVEQVEPGQHLYRLAPGTEPLFQPLMDRVLAGETVRLNSFAVESGGIVSYWDIVLTPLPYEQTDSRDGSSQVTGILAVFSDATERIEAAATLRQTVATLQEREERLDLAVQAANDGIYDWDITSGHTYYSPRCSAMLGYNEQEMDSHYNAWLKLLHPDDKSRVLATLNAYLTGQIDSYREEYRLRHKNGSYRWILARGLLVRDKTGRSVRLVGSHTDVTEQRRVQHHLEQRVAERTQELQSLLEVSHTAASTLELEPLLYDILERLKKVVDYTGATFLGLEADELVVLAHRGPIAPEVSAQLRFPLHHSASQQVINNREAVIISDVRQDLPLAHLYRTSADSKWQQHFEYVRSWLSVPLLVKDRVIGILSLDHEQPDYYKPQHARLALAFAGQVATHIENAQLYAETRQRADEIQSLFTVQQAIARRLDPDAVLQMIADEARRLTDTEMSAVYLRRDNELEIAVVSGQVSERFRGYRFPLDQSVAGLAIRQKRPYRVTDVETHNQAYRSLTDRVGAHSFIVVPLLLGEEAIGTITVANRNSGMLSAEDERVLAMLASGAVNALENARLFSRLEQRTQEIEALYRADEKMYSHLQLDEVLDALVEIAVEIMKADKSSLLAWDENERLVVRAQRGFRPATLRQMTFGPEEGMVGRAATLGELIVVEDVQQEKNVALRVTEAEGIQAFMHIPIEIGGQLFGILNVSYEAPRTFADEDRRLFIALAQRAALVIENARLYERAQEAATAEERNRLARELHDAVTQTLFSASLIADVLPRIWEKDEVQGRLRLEELRELTRGALAEMRTLLLELRPATLTEVSMKDLLRQLTDASIGRARLPVELEILCQQPLPPDIQVALYRIAQESLNNVIKHANASQARVRLECLEGGVRLSVTDNGRGFVVDDIGHHSLGLRIMRERAEKIGASLSIESYPGQGTLVEVGWQPDGENRP